MFLFRNFFYNFSFFFLFCDNNENSTKLNDDDDDDDSMIIMMRRKSFSKRRYSQIANTCVRKEKFRTFHGLIQFILYICYMNDMLLFIRTHIRNNFHLKNKNEKSEKLVSIQKEKVFILSLNNFPKIQEKY